MDTVSKPKRRGLQCAIFGLFCLALILFGPCSCSDSDSSANQRPRNIGAEIAPNPADSALCAQAEAEARIIFAGIHEIAKKIPKGTCCPAFVLNGPIGIQYPIPNTALNAYSCKKWSCKGGGFLMTAKTKKGGCMFTMDHKKMFKRKRL